jgi:hypothetical protein
VTTHKSNDDARRAYLRRFSEGWSTFHAEPTGLEEEYVEPAPPPIVTRKSRNPREAYVRRFAHRWWSFHRAEDEEGSTLGMAVYILIKGSGFAIVGFLTWFTFEASRPVQWMVLGALTAAAAAFVFWQIIKPKWEEPDE